MKSPGLGRRVAGSVNAKARQSEQSDQVMSRYNDPWSMPIPERELLSPRSFVNIFHCFLSQLQASIVCERERSQVMWGQVPQVVRIRAVIFLVGVISVSVSRIIRTTPLAVRKSTCDICNPLEVDDRSQFCFS